MPIKLWNPNKEYKADERAIPKGEFLAMRDNFNRYFGQGDPLQNNLANKAVPVSYRLLRDLLEPLVIPGSNPPHKIGVKIHFGIDGNALKLAFSPIAMVPIAHTDPQEYDLTHGEPWEIVTDGSGNETWQKVVDWDLRWKNELDSPPGTKGYIDKYYDMIRADRDGGSSAQGPSYLEPLRDPCSCIVPWEDELRELERQNRPATGYDPLKSIYIITHSATDFPAGDGGFAGLRHGLCFHIKYNGVEKLDPNQEDPVLPFKYRAADLANPCPPRCKKYTDPNM